MAGAIETGMIDIRGSVPPVRFDTIPLPAVEPAGDPIAAALYALAKRWVEAKTGDDWMARVAESIPTLLHLVMAYGETVEAKHHDGTWNSIPRDKLIEDADEFGGDKWADAVEDGWADAFRAIRVYERVLQNMVNGNRDTTLKALSHSQVFIMLFFAAVLSFQLVRSGRATPDVEIRVREVMRHSPRKAYALARQIELEARDAAQVQEELAPSARTSDPELEALEQFAHDCALDVAENR